MKKNEGYEGFDYEAYDAEHGKSMNDDDIYIDEDEREPFTIVVVETVKKYITVWAETVEEALEAVQNDLNNINMEKDIDSFERYCHPFDGEG